MFNDSLKPKERATAVKLGAVRLHRASGVRSQDDMILMEDVVGAAAW